MDIFFIKKDVSCFFSVIAWAVFCLVEIVGTTYITVPIATVFFDMLCCLCFCMILYDGRIRKKLVWVAIIQLLGMLTEMIVGYIFIYADLGFNSTKILGSFISKTIPLSIFPVIDNPYGFAAAAIHKLRIPIILIKFIFYRQTKFFRLC